MPLVVIGVTGVPGSGKSTVAKLFAQCGSAVLDADAVVHELLQPGTAAFRDIVRVFGRGILDAGGAVDRKRLGAAVFTNTAKRRQLERILHPRVWRRMRGELGRLARAGRVKAAVLDVPLLFESGGEKFADAVVVVAAPTNVRYRRLKQRHGWTRKEVDARTAAQWSLSAKVVLADFVVDNGRTLSATRKQVNGLWKTLVARRRQS